jgi:predicted esterase
MSAASDRLLAVRGPQPSAARGALLLLHGRGSSAEDILSLAGALPPSGFAFVAPRAEGGTWYPHRFIEPLERNVPELSRSLGRVGEALAWLAGQGLDEGRVILVGFSQGACLAAEYCARHARRYGGLAVLSGGLIGPPGLERSYGGSLEGTPVFVGCSDVDPHIPLDRVRETTLVLSRLGAAATERIYPGFGHEVNGDEIEQIAAMMARLAGEGPSAGDP